ncbi:hypothetical protein SmphiM6_111 [Sinorhizobium phage phiM6]|nr:hypothetical protein SmphiM6_111 [Sinorhizobium phage phiM6]
MYILYQPNLVVPACFEVGDDFYWVMKPMGPSACQWIVPGTVDPRED